MIIEFVFNSVFFLLKTVLGFLPNVPAMDSTLINSVNSFLNTVFGNLQLLGFFVRITTLKLIIPFLIIAINFERLYKFTMWVIKKLPIGVKD